MTLFLAIFDPSSSIGKSIFDCRLPSVIMKQKCGFYLFSLLLEFMFIDRISTKHFPKKVKRYAKTSSMAIWYARLGLTVHEIARSLLQEKLRVIPFQAILKI